MRAQTDRFLNCDGGEWRAACRPPRTSAPRTAGPANIRPSGRCQSPHRCASRKGSIAPPASRRRPLNANSLSSLGATLRSSPLPNNSSTNSFPLQGLATIFGNPGSFESFVALHIALCVALDRHWVDVGSLKGTSSASPPKARPVCAGAKPAIRSHSPIFPSPSYPPRRILEPTRGIVPA
jgi:hypothetical protein